MESLYLKIGKTNPALSRLFVYYVTRVQVEGTAPTDDSGCEIRDVMQALHTYGTCLEDLWQYDINDFSAAPSQSAYDQALNHKILRYVSCPDVNSVKECMAQGYTVVGGFSVPQNMMSDQCAATGDVQYPMPNESIVGGHCVLFTGYDDATQRFIFQNSWGTEWGASGYGSLPYQFLDSGLADDFWCLYNEQMR